MSEGWAKGDLALCLDNTPIPREREAHLLVIGRIYKVSACGIPDGGERFCLAFREISPHDPKRGNAYSASRFRKIKPDTEPCEEEFTVLIKRGKKVAA